MIGLLFFSVSGFGQGTLSGKVVDKKTGEPILFGDVVVYQDGKLIIGEQTDFDGYYNISSLNPGIYDLVFKYVCYHDFITKDVIIKANEKSKVDAMIFEKSESCCDVVIRHINVPIIEQDDFDKGRIFTKKGIERMPNKN
jgi:hypothetical protein